MFPFDGIKKWLEKRESQIIAEEQSTAIMRRIWDCGYRLYCKVSEVDEFGLDEQIFSEFDVSPVDDSTFSYQVSVKLPIKDSVIEAVMAVTCPERAMLKKWGEPGQERLVAVKYRVDGVATLSADVILHEKMTNLFISEVNKKMDMVRLKMLDKIEKLTNQEA